jgi:hypothetical protein
MPATYVDQVQKLDVRSLMAAAFKSRPGHHYTVYRDAEGWHAADRVRCPRPLSCSPRLRSTGHRSRVARRRAAQR